MPMPSPERRSWTDDDLAAAVRAAQSWRGVLRNLGLYPGGPNYILKREAQRLGLDTSHFGSGPRWTDEQLKAALATAASWRQLLSALGLRPESRRAREKVRDRAAQLNLNLGHLTSPHVGETDPPGRWELAPDTRYLRNAAVSIAQAWLLLRGLWPAVPAEPRPYDLLAEGPKGLKRIQVKTTTRTADKGSSPVGIGRHAGGGDRHEQRVPYRPEDVDLFMIIDGDLSIYVVPLAAVAGRLVICLGRYRGFIAGSAASVAGPSCREGKPPGGRPAVPDSQLDRDARECSSTASALVSSLLADPQVGPAAVPSHPSRTGHIEPSNQPATDGESPARWTEERLRLAVEKATSWADLLRAFGYKPSSTRPRKALQRDIQRYRIDTEHFAGKRTWSDGDLMTAAPVARTWPELCAALGLSATAGSRESIHAAARRLSLDLRHLGSGINGPKVGCSAIDAYLLCQPSLGRLRNAAPSISAAWFLLCGCAVSTPCEPEVYDLVVHLAGRLNRVQVKTTTARDSRGSWIVRIGHRPGGSSHAADFIPYAGGELDSFFVIDGDMMLYLIPAAAVAGKASLILRWYRRFIVGDASSLMESSPWAPRAH